MNLFLLLFGILILATILYLYYKLFKLKQNIDESQQAKQKAYSKENSEINSDYYKLEENDIDKGVDEIPDDCLIYNELFSEE